MYLLNVNKADQNETIVLGQEDHYTQIPETTCSTEFLLHTLVAEDSTEIQFFRFVTVTTLL